jgi:hypothetical protein
MRCTRCGRRVGIYLNEVSGRYVAHLIPLALHRAVLPIPLASCERLCGGRLGCIAADMRDCAQPSEPES